MDINDIIASLPDPKKDKRPPPAMASSSDLAKAKADEEYESQFIDIPYQSEWRAKYLLCDSPHVGAYLTKDGDWVTLVNGRRVYQKKVADFVGGVPVAGSGVNAHLYVEVKSMSPGKSFSLARLDRPNRKGAESQHEKLTKVMKNGAFVWLVLAVWDALPGKRAVIEKRKGRKYTRWRTGDVDLVFYIIEWSFWLETFLPSLGDRRSFKRKDLAMLEFCKISKERGRWVMHENHWLKERIWMVPDPFTPEGKARILEIAKNV